MEYDQVLDCSGDELSDTPYWAMNSPAMRAWPAYLTNEFNTSVTVAYKFVGDGATIDSHQNRCSPSSFAQQTNTFLGGLASKKPRTPHWDADNALAVAYFGNSDIGCAGPETVQPDNLLQKEIDLLGKLYDSGLRKFAILNIPPMEKTPDIIACDELRRHPRPVWFSNGPCNAETLAAAIANWNDRLPAYVDKFVEAHPDADAEYIDVHAAWEDVMANPKKYDPGLMNCISIPENSNCMWYDAKTPSLVLQKVTARAVAAAFKGSIF